MIFQGAGILVLLALAMPSLVSTVLELALGSAPPWADWIGIFLAGVGLVFVGKSLNRESSVNEFFTPHTCMFIRIEHWGALYIFIALFVAIMNFS
jgi:hypothetical protein